ncbi:MAG: O-antigen ligase family protein [Thiobacillus sp.]|nr:O-antigen ligase family protein [Thiobacillus sp.]
MMQYAFLSAYFLAALIIPLAFIGVLWGMFRISSQRNDRVFWGGLIGMLALLPVLTDLRITRGEFVDGVLRDVWVPPAILQFLALWGARGMTYLLLGFSLVVIAKTIFSRHVEKRTGTTLFLAYLALVVPSFISSVFGSNPVFIHFIFYGPLFFALAYLAQPALDWLWYVKQFKRVLLIYISLSALMGLIVPSWTTGAALTLIPGFTFRLHGIFSHSNSLGMTALVYLVLDMADDSPKTIYRKAAWLISFAVLVAAQSKTAWVGALLTYGIYIIYKVQSRRSPKVDYLFAPAIVVGLIFLAGLSGLLLAFSSGGWFRGLDTETYNTLTTFTGRTTLWEITVNTWRDNPIFGYGPSLWDIDYRIKYAPQQLLYSAGMAHNQFFQTLGESGVLGVIGLSLYVLILVKYGIKYFSTTRGASLALVVVLLTRSISETPFRNQALDLMFFVHFGVFVLLLSLEANANKTKLTTATNLEKV